MYSIFQRFRQELSKSTLFITSFYFAHSARVITQIMIPPDCRPLSLSFFFKSKYSIHTCPCPREFKLARALTVESPTGTCPLQLNASAKSLFQYIALEPTVNRLGCCKSLLSSAISTLAPQAFSLLPEADVAETVPAATVALTPGLYFSFSSIFRPCACEPCSKIHGEHLL